MLSETSWRALTTAVVAFTVGMVVLTIAYNVQSTDERNLTLAALAALIAISPFLVLRKTDSPFEPLNFLILIFILGTIWKIVYLFYDRSALERNLSGEPFGILLEGFWVIVLGVSLFALTYLLTVKYCPTGSKYNAPSFQDNVTITVCLVILIMSAIAASLVINEFKFSNEISSQRFSQLDGASSRFKTTLYLYYKLALLSRVSFYLSLLGLFFGQGTQKKMLIVIASLSFIISFTVPILFNARANALLIIFDFVAIAWASGIKIGARYLLASVAISVSAFVYMTVSRAGDRFTNIVDALMGHPYFLDLTKTSHIVNYFSDSSVRLHGETLVGWLFIPIPDSWMSGEKPMFMELGKYIVQKMYGGHYASGGTGIPAGYVGELFLNFGYLGVVFGMSIAGVVMALVWIWYKKNVGNVLTSTVFALISVRFGIYLFNNDFGTFALKNVLETLPTALAISLAISPSLSAALKRAE